MRWSVVHSFEGSMGSELVKIIRHESKGEPVTVHNISFRRSTLDWPPKSEQLRWDDVRKELEAKGTFHANTPEEAAERFVQILEDAVQGLTKDYRDYYRNEIKERISE